MFLCLLLEHVRSMDEPEMSDAPDLDSYVFALVTQPYGVVAHDGQDTIDLQNGDLVAIKYRAVQSHVLDGGIKLI